MPAATAAKRHWSLGFQIGVTDPPAPRAARRLRRRLLSYASCVFCSLPARPARALLFRRRNLLFRARDQAQHGRFWGEIRCAPPTCGYLGRLLPRASGLIVALWPRLAVFACYQFHAPFSNPLNSKLRTNHTTIDSFVVSKSANVQLTRGANRQSSTSFTCLIGHSA